MPLPAGYAIKASPAEMSVDQASPYRASSVLMLLISKWPLRRHIFWHDQDHCDSSSKSDCGSPAPTYSWFITWHSGVAVSIRRHVQVIKARKKRRRRKMAPIRTSSRGKFRSASSKTFLCSHLPRLTRTGINPARRSGCSRGFGRSSSAGRGASRLRGCRRPAGRTTRREAGLLKAHGTGRRRRRGDEAETDGNPVVMAVYRQGAAMQAAERQHGGAGLRADARQTFQPRAGVRHRQSLPKSPATARRALRSCAAEYPAHAALSAPARCRAQARLGLRPERRIADGGPAAGKRACRF